MPALSGPGRRVGQGRRPGPARRSRGGAAAGVRVGRGGPAVAAGTSQAQVGALSCRLGRGGGPGRGHRGGPLDCSSERGTGRNGHGHPVGARRRAGLRYRGRPSWVFVSVPAWAQESADDGPPRYYRLRVGLSGGEPSTSTLPAWTKATAIGDPLLPFRRPPAHGLDHRRDRQDVVHRAVQLTTPGPFDARGSQIKTSTPHDGGRSTGAVGPNRSKTRPRRLSSTATGQ